MIGFKDRHHGEVFYLNEELVEAVYPREGNTAEIVTTTGKHYTTIESAESVSKKLNTLKKLSEEFR